MKKLKGKKTFHAFFQKEFLIKKQPSFTLETGLFINSSFKIQTPFPVFSGRENLIADPFFFNYSFDKGRLKSVVAWFLEKHGQYKTIQLLEKLKEFGFGYATKGGLSLGIDDLKIPNQKIAYISKAETKVSKDLMDYRNAKITGIERMQRLIYTWNQTNDMLKQEVIKYFEAIDLFNPIYMMAFSGARGNMSQVRQLVGMRGLMSDPQGQIIDFPIQSNFREGLTLTEYLISTYGARKGIVDTALRTATAGYLTRRLVDVAQHVIVSQFDCGTLRGIFLFDMKEANKTIYSFQNRLIGRVLAQDIFEFFFQTSEKKSIDISKGDGEVSTKTRIASRNQEIDSKLAFAISKVTKKAFVRSPLTCETPRLICQLCYGWSLSQGKLVSVGEAVGVIAAQSIGEPGTQLTMRTFHTGGVFAGGLTDQILAPFDGKLQYLYNIPGSCIRTSLSEIAFFTKMPGSFFLMRGNSGNKDLVDLSFTPEIEETSSSNFQNQWKQKNKNTSFSEIYKIPAYAILFVRNHEFVQKKQVLAQFSTFGQKQLQYGSAEQTLYSTLAGEFFLSTSSIPFQKRNPLKKIDLIVERRSSDSLDLSPIELKNDILWKLKNWTNIWILSGKVLYNSLDSKFFLQQGDFITKTTLLNRILWKKKKSWDFSLFFQTPVKSIPIPIPFGEGEGDKEENVQRKKKLNMFYSRALETHKNARSSFFFQTSVLLFFQTSEKKNRRLSFFASFVARASTTGSKYKICKKRIKKQKEKRTNNSLKDKRKVFQQNSLTSKNFFVSSDSKTVLRQVKFLPFHPFSSNFSNSYKKQTFKTRKFLKPKKDVLFSSNFHKFFRFKSKNQKKFLNQKQKILTGWIYKKKKPFKQIFLKFSTFGRTAPFFRVYNFAKKLNSSQKFLKKESFNSLIFQKKNYPHPLWGRGSKRTQFFCGKSFSKGRFNRSNQLLKLLKVKSSKIEKTKNKQFFDKTNLPKKFYTGFSFEKVKKANFISGQFLKFHLFNPRMVKNLKSPQKQYQNLHSDQNFQKEILCKKTLFHFEYEKVRYKKFGYLFSFYDFSKNQFMQNSLRTFTTIKQQSLSGKRTINSGKQQKGISIGNSHFFGKDFPTFLSYCFPKKYETFTNGIFTILPFENFSKKKKLKKFLSFKEKSSSFVFFDNPKLFKNPKQKKDRKKYNSAYVQKRVKFSKTPTFDFVSENLCFFPLNSYKNPKTNNIFQLKAKSLEQKEFCKNFSFGFQKYLRTTKKCTHQSIFSVIKTYKKNRTFPSFLNSEFYTEEIFWIPQENYTLSIVDFPQQRGKRKKQFESKTKGYISDMVFQKNPMFYLSNRQGKKKLFFPTFEGIWNWSIFTNGIKYRQFSFFFQTSEKKVKTQKILPQKNFDGIQQKVSFYKFGKLKAMKKKNLSSSFFNLRKQNKKEKSSLNFLKFQYFFKNFSFFFQTSEKKEKLSNKQYTFVKNKKRIFFKFSSKSHFSKKFTRKLHFSDVFPSFSKQEHMAKSPKKLKKITSKAIKNLFFDTFQRSSFFQNTFSFGQKSPEPKTSPFLFSKTEKQEKNLLNLSQQTRRKFSLEAKVGKVFQNQCFSCVPYQKFVPKKNLRIKQSNSRHLESQKMHIKIQPGWICLFPNESSLFNWHQTIANIGQVFGKDLCFEQNKLLRETIVLNVSSSSSNPQMQSSFQNLSNNKIAFSVQLVKTNENCRFVNNDWSIALQNFGSTFVSTTELEPEANVCNNYNLQIKNTNFYKHKKIFALFLRPMQYKLVENPKNYKNSFMNRTIKNSSTKSNSICFISSLIIYKKYHSPLLNFQKPEKIFLQNSKNIDSTVCSGFQKMNSARKLQTKSTYQRFIFPRTTIMKFKKNQTFLDFRLTKKDTIKKFSHLKEYSKKTLLKKFITLLMRNSSTTFLEGLDVTKNSFFSKEKQLLKSQDKVSFDSSLQTKLFNKNIHGHYFFSFYPVQFLPLVIYNSSFHNFGFDSKNSRTFPRSFLNPVNTTIEFSMIQKKSLFLNQRFPSFDLFKNYERTSSFWLNKDGFNFVFSKFGAKKNSTNFWKTSFSAAFIDSQEKDFFYPKEERKSYLKKSFQYKNKKLYHLNQNKNRKTFSLFFQTSEKTEKKTLFKNFIYKKNQHFYANTKLFSPFQGELISMYTNETNWWKKASEISTLQKLSTLFSVVTKKDLFSLHFLNQNSSAQATPLGMGIGRTKNSSLLNIKKTNGTEQFADESLLYPLHYAKNNLFISPPLFDTKNSFFFQTSEKKVNNNKIVQTIFKYPLKNKQNHLISLYQFVLKSQKNFFVFHSFSENSELSSETFSLNNEDGHFYKNKRTQKLEISSFATKYENKIYKFKNLKIGYPMISKYPKLGKFLVYGDCLFNFAIRKPGQVVHLSSFKVTLRHGQPFLVSPNGILHLANTPYIKKDIPILTLPYQTVQSGDIVQGIPKVEQLFEARTTIQGRLFLSSLPILLKGIFERYKSMLPLEQAVRQSFLKIQQLIVDGVQRVYRSQGVSIVDKHLEVIVRQMTTKVQILHGAQTGFFPGELVNLNLVERINKFLLVKIRYEPVVLGITRASLEVDSFLSASSFQQTTKILSLASISRKKDFLKGLKENILVGNLIPSGTGYMVIHKNL